MCFSIRLGSPSGSALAWPRVGVQETLRPRGRGRRWAGGAAPSRPRPLGHSHAGGPRVGHRGRLTHPQRLRRFGVPRGLVWQGELQRSPWQRAPRGTSRHLTNPGRRGRGLGGACSGKCSTAGRRAVTIATRVSRETRAPDWVAAWTRPELRRSPLVTKAGPDRGM